MPEFRKSLWELSIYQGAVSLAIWLLKMLLATRRSAKRFLQLWSRLVLLFLTRSTETAGAKFQRKTPPPMTEALRCPRQRKLPAFMEIE
jgi:hypothetical protein